MCFFFLFQSHLFLSAVLGVGSDDVEQVQHIFSLFRFGVSFEKETILAVL